MSAIPRVHAISRAGGNDTVRFVASEDADTLHANSNGVWMQSSHYITIAVLMAKVQGEIEKFKADTIAALIAGDSRKLEKQSETLSAAFQIAGSLMLDVADFLTNDETMTYRNVGRIQGAIAYEAVEALLTAGAAKSMKAGRIADVATSFLTKINNLANQGKLPTQVLEVLTRYGYRAADGTVSAEKVSEVVYHVADKFCFTRDTLVWTPEGTKPIGMIEPGRFWLLTSPKQSRKPMTNGTDWSFHRSSQELRSTIHTRGWLPTMRCVS